MKIEKKMKIEQIKNEETETQNPMQQAEEKRRMARRLREIADDLREYYDLTIAPRQLEQVADWIERGEV